MKIGKDNSRESDYAVVCVNEFAQRNGLGIRDAFRYLAKFKGLDFLHEFYDVEHLLSFDEVIDDLKLVCGRNGGMLA